MKALGCGWRHGVGFQDIAILRDQNGKPLVELRGQAQEIARRQGVAVVHLSLSHSRSVAVAYVVCVGRG